MPPQKSYFCLYNTNCMKMITFDILKRYWWTILLFEFHLWILLHEDMIFQQKEISFCKSVSLSQIFPEYPQISQWHSLSFDADTVSLQVYSSMKSIYIALQIRWWWWIWSVGKEEWCGKHTVKLIMQRQTQPTSPGSNHIPCLPFSSSHNQTITLSLEGIPILHLPGLPQTTW